MKKKTTLPRKPGIYLLTNKINKKIYIGKTNNLYNRIEIHKRTEKEYRDKDKSAICNSIRKHGWGNFTVKILEVFDEIDNKKLLDIESEYILQYKALDRKIGYNLVLYSNDMTGYKHTEQSKANMRAGQLKAIKEGRKVYLKGKDHPMFGFKHTEETLKRLSELHKGKTVKAIKQIDLKTGEVIKIWPSIIEAAKSLGRPQASATIIKVCKKTKNKNRHIKGKYYIQKQALGFKWEYVNP